MRKSNLKFRTVTSTKDTKPILKNQKFITDSLRLSVIIKERRTTQSHQTTAKSKLTFHQVSKKSANSILGLCKLT